jgi:hypothetical protein
MTKSGIPGAAAIVASALASPADVAAGVVGGEDYTRRNGFARRNGFVCVPGTWFRGEDGRRHICQ